MLYGYRKYAILFFIVFFSVGIAGTLLPPTFDLFLKLFPLALLLSFAALLVFSDSLYNIQTYLAVLLVAISGFLVEAAGVNTGRIFGNYSYGGTLGLKLFGTPLIIGINWAMLVFATSSITDKTRLPVSVKIILASLLMVCYDLFLEQVAGILDMWHWKDNIVPIQNYLAWFLIALILHSLVRISNVKRGFWLAMPILLCQTAFFIILTIFSNFVT